MVVRRLVALLGALFGLGLVLAAPAAAHAELVTSNPYDGERLRNVPRTVTLTFDESAFLKGVSYVHVTDQAGRRVDVGAAYHPGGDGSRVAENLRAGLGDGSYTVSFRVISDDSHPVSGSFAFVVGSGPLVRGPAGASTVDPVVGDAFDVARWISFAGLALLGGSWLLYTIWPSGRDERRARRLIWSGWSALVVGGALELLLQGPYSAGASLAKITDGSLLNDTRQTIYGELHAVRLILLGVLAFHLGRTLRGGARVGRLDALGLGAIGIAIVWTFSRGGHGATTAPAWLSVSVDMTHLLAVATWIGGLVMLAFVAIPRGDPDEVRSILPTFSTVAFTSVCVLAASGLYSAWRGIGTVHAIFNTTYGLIVVCKIILLLGILTVANFVSRRLVRQRVVAYAMTDAIVEAESETDDRTTMELLRRAVAVEAVIGLIVLGFSAVLVSEPRGKEALAANGVVVHVHGRPVLSTGTGHVMIEDVGGGG